MTPEPTEQPSQEETPTPQPDPVPEPDSSSDAPTDSTDSATDTSSTDSPEEPTPTEPETPPTDNSQTDGTDESQPSSNNEEQQPQDSSNTTQDNQSQETSSNSTPESVVADALADGKLTTEEKAAVVEALVSSLAPGEALSATDMKAAGLTYSDLPPATPVDVRTDENGNPVIIEAEVAAALTVLESPSELIGAIFDDPTQVLLALGSIGADMSPQEREEATKMVVATVVATGAALNAVGLSTGGSTPSNSGGGGSSGGGGPSGDSKAVRRRRENS